VIVLRVGEDHNKTKKRGLSDCFNATRLSSATHRIPIHWLVKTNYTQITYPSTRDYESSRSNQATAKYTFNHPNLSHIHLCLYKTLPECFKIFQIIFHPHIIWF